MDLFTFEGIKIPPNVISSLSLLEELNVNLEVGSPSTTEEANLAKVEVVVIWTDLLKFYIRKCDFLFSEFSNLDCLKVVNIRVGGHLVGYPTMKIVILDDTLAASDYYDIIGTRDVELCRKPQLCNQLLGFEFDFFKCLRMLHISSWEVKIIFPSMLSTYFVCLKELEVNHCRQLAEVFHFDDLNPEQNMLPSLAVISLTYLPELTNIWSGTIPPASFQNLEDIRISVCPKLIKLFTPSVAEGLKELMFLCISFCFNLATIMSSDVEEDAMTRFQNSEPEKILFPKLKILLLNRLPKMKNFVQSEILLDFPSLEELTVYRCPKLKTLPFGLGSLPKLRKLSAERQWFEQLQWQDEGVKRQLERCFVDWP